MIRSAIERPEHIALWVDSEGQGDCRCLSWFAAVRLTIAGMRLSHFAEFAANGPFVGGAAVPVGEWVA